MDKDKLKKKYIAGNKRAFDIIYNDFSAAMHSICIRYTKDRDSASDVLHDAFIKIFEKRHLFKPHYELTGWIKRIVVNTAIDYYKKNKKLILIDNQDFFETEDDTLIDTNKTDISKEVLLKALNELSDSSRIVFNLYVFENLTHDEISKHLGITISNSKSRLSRSRKKLREILEKHNKINKQIVNG